MIIFKVSGKFRVCDSEGLNLTPRGMKARGLLSLLLLAPEYSRTRRFIQDKLWSTRSSEQASSSLRQSLTEIRRSLQQYKHILITDGINVSLDISQVIVEREQSEPQLLFEDVEINDPAFANWILTERSSEPVRFIRVVSQDIKGITGKFHPVLVVDTPAMPVNSIEHHCNTCVKSMIVSMNIESTDLNVVDISAHGGSASDELVKAQDGFLLQVSTVQSDSGCTSHVQLRSLSKNGILWMDMCKSEQIQDISVDEMNRDMRRLISHLISNLYKAMPTLCADNSRLQFFAPFLFQKAQRELFSLRKENLINADRLLGMAYANQKNGMYLAWKAYVQNIARSQYPTENFHHEMGDSISLLENAIAISPNNSFVNAILAQHEYTENNNMVVANALAQRSIEYNPSNPFSWAILANAQLALSDMKKSQKSVSIANELSKHSEYQFFIDFFNCMISAGSGEYKKAIHYAEMARASNRSFVAPLRYLIPLYKNASLEDSYQTATQKLKALEPDFDMSRYNDPSYPVNTLRKIPLIDCVV